MLCVPWQRAPIAPAWALAPGPCPAWPHTHRHGGAAPGWARTCAPPGTPAPTVLRALACAPPTFCLTYHCRRRRPTDRTAGQPAAWPTQLAGDHPGWRLHCCLLPSPFGLGHVSPKRHCETAAAFLSPARQDSWPASLPPAPHMHTQSRAPRGCLREPRAARPVPSPFFRRCCRQHGVVPALATSRRPRGAYSWGLRHAHVQAVRTCQPAGPNRARHLRVRRPVPLSPLNRGSFAKPACSSLRRLALYPSAVPTWGATPGLSCGRHTTDQRRVECDSVIVQPRAQQPEAG